MIEVDRQDLEKIRDVLSEANEFHRHRDEMNAHLHLARRVRYSPLTVEIENAFDRVDTLLGRDDS